MLTTHQLALFEALHQSRLEDVKTFNKRDYRGIWNSVINKYPESAHFVYEMLQNADDAEATDVSIVLTDSQVLFKHNGTRHFDVTSENSTIPGDINSITGIGNSSKADTQNKIGKFGVGFKAVFQYTDIPEIYDDIFKFKIENYIVPTLLDKDFPTREEGETMFVFPFKEENKQRCFDDIKNRLHNLRNPLLFLRHLQKISWQIVGEGKTYEYKKQLEEKLEFSDRNITMTKYKLFEPKRSSSIFLFSMDVQVNFTDDEGDTHTQNHPIFVGFYYDEEKGKLITDVQQDIYCFFPTKETFKTCFVSHAPFLLTDNRQNLKPSEKVNDFLVGRLARLAANAVLCLRDYGKNNSHILIDENLTEIIPKYKDNDYYWNTLDDVFEQPIYEEFEDLIKFESIFLSRNGKYLGIEESRIGAAHDLLDLLNQQQLNDLQDNLEYKVDFLKWELAQNIRNQNNNLYEDIEWLNPESLGSSITKSFMDKQDIKWVTKLYTYLRNTPSLWKISENKNASFKSTPIIKTNCNDWVAPYDGSNNLNVFLPLDGNKTPKGYNFINQEYLDNPLSMKFFKELEVKQPDESAYITQIILAKFKTDKININLDILGKDFNSLLSYYKKIDGQPEEEHYIKEVKENIYLYCTDGLLHPIYDFTTYQRKYLLLQNPMLEKYFVAPRNVLFVDVEFYSKYCNQGDGVLIKFLSKLGVQEYPIVEDRLTYLSMLSERQRLLIKITNYKEYRIEDYIMDGFLNLCTSGVPKDVSVYIWNEMLPAISFAKYETLTFAYRQPYAQSFLYAYYPSTFKDNLQNLSWIYDNQGTLLAPRDIALEDLAPEYDLNNGLLHFLGIEKREKSIVEMGGTMEQQENMELGKKIKNALGDDLTPEEALQLIIDARAKKRGNNAQQAQANEPTNKTKLEQNENKIDDILNSNKGKENELPTQRQKPNRKRKDETEEEWLEKLENNERLNRQLDIAEDPTKRYTMEWFDTLLDMELDASGEKNTSNGGIKIRFAKVEKDPTSGKSVFLRNPNRSIPRSLEEMSNIVVVFHFAQREVMTITFEVASVQDYVLRLKCKNEDAQTIKELLSYASEVLYADLNTENPIQLISKLRNAFHELGKEDDFSFKEHINPNIQFVFGPPGTGKTTHLVRKWINKIAAAPKGKMLVLCPTNKAADVIAERALTTLNPLSNPDSFIFRFVATADERLNNNVCSRESNVFYQDKCCVISTIARFSYDGFIDQKLRDIDWDYIVIDEASMIPLAEIIYPLYQCSKAKIVIAGDPFQIEPIVMVDEWKDENIYKMINLKDFQDPHTQPCAFQITNLSTQYRSVPAIGRLFSHYMYGGGVNSDRVQSSQRALCLDGYDAKSVNFIMCPVERGASIFGAQRLAKSNIHIYSALFTFEFLIWVANNIQRQTNDKPWRIGVVSPYRAQADLINKLWEQRKELFPDVDVLISTVHGFQGDECDIIIAVYNPPASGMKLCADDTFVNKRNILNVAISRAQDYLFLLMPDNDYEYFYKLEATRIFEIATKMREEMTMFDASDIERVMFNDKDYLAKNTFVTSHQLANVYTEPVSKYEVRFDENSVDIQMKE